MHLLCTIRQNAEQTQYDFLIREAEATRTLSTERAVLASDRSRLDEHLDTLRKAMSGDPWARPDPQRNLECLRRLGDEITASLVPSGVSQMLSDPGLCGATLMIETNESRVPWELMVVEGEWLWERFVVARREIFVARRSQTIPGASRPRESARGPLRLLVVADPESSLPAALDEARQIGAAFAQNSHWTVDVLLGREATTGRLIELLQTVPYTALHFACSADYNAVNPLRSQLFLADEPLPAGRLWDLRFRECPRMVFLNACQAGSATPRGLLSRASGWGRLFLDLGVAAVIGPLWDVADVWSAHLTGHFYRGVLDGLSLGEALRDARQRTSEAAAREDGLLTAHAYVYHGDPTVRLERSRKGSTSAPTEPWVLKPRFHLEVVQGPAAGQRVALLPQTMLEGRRITIGFAGERTNEIDLDDPDMANEEAYLEFQRGGYVLYNQSGDPVTTVNRDVVEKPVRLAPDDVVHIGGTTLVFRAGPPPEQRVDAARPASGEQSRFSLQVMDGSTAGRIYPLVGAQVVIGRLPDCAVRFDDVAVSRRHACVSCSDDVWFIRPEGSNPVIVNAVVVTRERRLHHGDEIQLSEQSVLRFVDDEKEVFT